MSEGVFLCDDELEKKLVNKYFEKINNTPHKGKKIILDCLVELQKKMASNILKYNGKDYNIRTFAAKYKFNHC